MATSAQRPPWALRARALVGPRTAAAATAIGLGGLVALSLVLRTTELKVGYWIDEGLSVGIADRPLTDIPGVLRLDGSPPLYYMLLSVWMRLVGSTDEVATHSLSLLLALGTIPIAYFGARIAFGARAAWIAAGLFALNPFLSQYGQETRMYALVMFLATIVIGAYLAAFVRGRRAAIPVLAVSLAGVLYTHNWGGFFAAACGVGWLVLLAIGRKGERGRLLRAGVLAFGGTLLLYAPWVPTLLFQAAHTGAPWSSRPGWDDLSAAPARLLGPVGQVAMLLAAGAGAAAIAGRRRLDDDARAAIALGVVCVLTVVFAWGASQVSPAWATRYLSVALAPVLMLCALGLARAGRLGLVGLAVVAVIWFGSPGRSEKSNVRSVADAIAPSLRPGDLVISTQPEQIPVLDHYLPAGLEYATLWGRVFDLGVTDWRDGVDRLKATNPARDLTPLIDRLRPGQRLVLVQPTIYDVGRWNAPWTELVRVRSEAWLRALTQDSRVRVSSVVPPSPFPEHPNPVRATVMVKRSS